MAKRIAAAVLGTIALAAAAAGLYLVSVPAALAAYWLHIRR